MKIAIIGAGLIGKTLAKKFSVAGHKVTIADARGLAEIKDIADASGATPVEMDDVAKDIEVLIVSIPLLRIPDLAKTLEGKIDDNVVVVETTNCWPHRDGSIPEIENGTVNSVWVQEQMGRSVVKAFSNINAFSLSKEGKPKNTLGRIALAVAGDVQREIDVVMNLVDDAGFDALDAGPLADSWRQQPCSPAYCTDLELDELKKARASALRETLVEQQQLAFAKMQDIKSDFFDILVSGKYPDGFVDHAVDIYRSINNLQPRN